MGDRPNFDSEYAAWQGALADVKKYTEEVKKAKRNGDQRAKTQAEGYLSSAKQRVKSTERTYRKAIQEAVIGTPERIHRRLGQKLADGTYRAIKNKFVSAFSVDRYIRRGTRPRDILSEAEGFQSVYDKAYRQQQSRYRADGRNKNGVQYGARCKCNLIGMYHSPGCTWDGKRFTDEDRA